jgi:hypothetical protein
VKIEYRFLQLILSPVADDKVTLGLLHWDGRTLRLASSYEPLAILEPSYRETIRRAVHAIMQRASRVAGDVAQKPTLNIGLKHLFPVREGFGAALFWSPIRSITAEHDAEAHFEELRRQVRLDPPPQHRSRRFTTNDLRKRVLSIGEHIQIKEPERIKVEHEVKHLQEYVSPLSWRNGRWHHVIPFSLDGMTKADMDACARDLYGLVQLAIPKTDVSIVLAVIPESNMLAKAARDETRILLQALPERSVEVQPVERSGRHVELGELEERILRDVRASHKQ